MNENKTRNVILNILHLWYPCAQKSLSIVNDELVSNHNITLKKQVYWSRNGFSADKAP